MQRKTKQMLALLLAILIAGIPGYTEAVDVEAADLETVMLALPEIGFAQPALDPEPQVLANGENQAGSAAPKKLAVT